MDFSILEHALWFIVAISVLVAAHEFGHFIVARKLGFKVLRFSIGFGRPLLQWRGGPPDHIQYWLSMIPLGGYVKMLDEHEGPVVVGRQAIAHSISARCGSAWRCCWRVPRSTSCSRSSRIG